jgi:hypothetical protein
VKDPLAMYHILVKDMDVYEEPSQFVEWVIESCQIFQCLTYWMICSKERLGLYSVPIFSRNMVTIFSSIKINRRKTHLFCRSWPPEAKENA